MAYSIDIEKKAKKEFLKLSFEAQQTLASCIDNLKIEPRPIGVKKMMGLEGYRIRQGKYRILYTVDDSKKIIRIYKIGHRKEVYR